MHPNSRDRAPPEKELKGVKMDAAPVIAPDTPRERGITVQNIGKDRKT
jgi:hypothetical protein